MTAETFGLMTIIWALETATFLVACLLFWRSAGHTLPFLVSKSFMRRSYHNIRKKGRADAGSEKLRGLA